MRTANPCGRWAAVTLTCCPSRAWEKGPRAFLPVPVTVASGCCVCIHIRLPVGFLLAGPKGRAPPAAHGPREHTPVALHELSRPRTKALRLCHLGIAVCPSEGTEAQQGTEEQAPGAQDVWRQAPDEQHGGCWKGPAGGLVRDSAAPVLGPLFAGFPQAPS